MDASKVAVMVKMKAAKMAARRVYLSVETTAGTWEHELVAL